MIKIGVISDTHGFIDESILNFLADREEIWHAGDIGNKETAEKLFQVKPLVAVHGNIDGHETRLIYPAYQYFEREGLHIFITHIGGYPGKYEPAVREFLKLNKVDILVCGHSHILKVMHDKNWKLLHLNPGAAGINGFHQSRTAIRFEIDAGNIQQMEVLDIPRNKLF